MTLIVNLNAVRMTDVELVGGKNASIGEMIAGLKEKGLNVPGGFAITTQVFDLFLHQNNLKDKINQIESAKNLNLTALKKKSLNLQKEINQGVFSEEFIAEFKKFYAENKYKSVAVRSSAVSEDSPFASFAGMQETFLNITGVDNCLKAIKAVYASLFAPRSILYRQELGLKNCLISVGIQPMIRSDRAVSGVIFTLDTESGFDKVVLISVSYGLGEGIVQGAVTPDEFIVFKPTLQEKKSAILQKKLGTKSKMMVYTKSATPGKSVKTIKVPVPHRERFCITDAEAHELAKQAMLIEEYYGMPMDIEWAKDGPKGKIYILQARPETVKSQSNKQVLERYHLHQKSNILTEGQSIGHRIGSGKAQVIKDVRKVTKLTPGDIIVTDMTDPDWEPLMRQASAIVTNRGGRTCHAAIIARELGIPAVVGCHDATSKIRHGEQITVSCAEGLKGFVYQGNLPFSKKEILIENMPEIPVKLMLNVGNPHIAFESQHLPNHGVGLARIEFIISNMIGVHPNAALLYKKFQKPLQKQILRKSQGYKNPTEFYIEKLKEGMAMIAGAFYPKDVIFRFSDFKSNEYANLLGGKQFEPLEENPMLGFRGASRYAAERFKACFELECEAIKRLRQDMGLFNAHVMVPFVRTVAELKEVITLLKSLGLARGEQGLKIYMMCEIPSNVLLAAEFLEHVDGFSIGSNDLTQLTLGLDRDSSVIAHLFDERNAAVKILLKEAIEQCLKQGKYIGICGQGPSDHPDFATWLMQEGIQTMSLNPDTVVETWLDLKKASDGPTYLLSSGQGM